MTHCAAYCTLGGHSDELFPDVQGETVQDVILRVPFCKVFPSNVGIPHPHTFWVWVFASNIIKDKLAYQTATLPTSDHENARDGPRLLGVGLP